MSSKRLQVNFQKLGDSVGLSVEHVVAVACSPHSWFGMGDGGRTYVWQFRDWRACYHHKVHFGPDGLALAHTPERADVWPSSRVSR